MQGRTRVTSAPNNDVICRVSLPMAFGTRLSAEANTFCTFASRRVGAGPASLTSHSDTRLRARPGGKLSE